LLLRDCPAFEFSGLVFQITVPSSKVIETAYKDGTECSKILAQKIQMPGNHPKERIQHSKHGENLNSRKFSKLAVFIV
jgi:hypothetical protein